MDGIASPVGWRQLHSPVYKTMAYTNGRGLFVIKGYEQYGNQKWLHVSVSKVNKLPSWDAIKKVKDVFIGRNQKAIMILPPTEQYVNYHRFCMHLFCNLENDPLPDFTRGQGIL